MKRRITSGLRSEAALPFNPQRVTPEQRKAWGDAIRDARDARGLTQEQLVRLWGGSLSYLQKIENGAKGNAQTYQQLMDLLEPPTKRKKAS